MKQGTIEKMQLRWSGVMLLAVVVGLAAGCKMKQASAPNDQQMASDIQAKIKGESALAQQNIQVRVVNGVATLNGTVSDEASRSLAGNDSGTISGVKTVINNLTVQSAATASAPASEQTALAAAPAPAPEPSRSRDRDSRADRKKKHDYQRDDSNPVSAPVTPAYQPGPSQADNTPPPPPVQAAPPPPPQPTSRSRPNAATARAGPNRSRSSPSPVSRTTPSTSTSKVAASLVRPRASAGCGASGTTSASTDSMSRRKR